MRKYIKKLRSIETGFSVIELLVVISILAALAAVAGVSFGKYLNQGKAESYDAELHDIQTAVIAMLHESSSHQLDSTYTDVSDMDLVTADSGARVLSSYLNNLDPENRVRTLCTYSFSVNGTTTQKTP